MPLRDYQSHAIGEVYKSLRDHQSCILQMPTGSGKTHVAMAIIQHGLRCNRTVSFLVDRLSLVDQTVDRFHEAGIPLGVMQGNHPLYNPSKPVQVISVQTLKRRHEGKWPQSNLFIVDECHDQHQITYDLMQKRRMSKFIGLSATPFTTGLGLYWQDLVVATTTADLIEAGYLSPYDAYGPSAPNMAGARIYGGDWATNDAAERMAPLKGDIVTHYRSMADGKKAIAFTVNVRHAKALAREFMRQGVEADYVCGKDSEERRQTVLQRFRSGKIRVLCNCEVLTKGYDQPDIEVGIVARPTRSLSLHIQMLGRVLRTHPSKERALILDHAGNIERLGFPDDPLPAKLCDKERGVSTVDRRNDEPEPWNCPGCHHLNPPRSPQCEACGHRAEQRELPDAVPGVLQALSREGRADKQTVYAMLNSCAAQRGYRQGWVDHCYKALFGVWPRNIDKSLRMRPTREINVWVKERLENARKAYYAAGGKPR